MDTLIKNVTAAGTAEPLNATSFAVTSLVIRARPDNTGNVYVGGEDVDNTKVPWEPGDFIGYDLDYANFGLDLNKIYVDADNNGDGVYLYFVEPNAFTKED